jgi:uncharacterized protein (DUF58 family)
MVRIRDLLTPKDLQKVSSLQIVARLVVEGFCMGLHSSPHKGFSVEFKQHRPYVSGDEIKYLDWKVFGKTDRFYIREYEEETNLRATILLDVSGSMGYGNSEITKHYFSKRLAACLAYLMLKQQDSVGLVVFDHKIRNYIPPRAQPKHLHRLIVELDKARTGGETELAEVFHDLAPRLHRRGLIIIISDCFGDIPKLLSALAHFRHAHHEIIIFQIWDRDELEFPFSRWSRFDSLENSGDKHLVDCSFFRNTYLENLESFRKELLRGCSRHRIDLVPMITDRPYAEALAHYVNKRRKR